MPNSTSLNIDVLTASRQAILTNALAGHSLELSGGKFTTISHDSLIAIGLTPIEILALEQANVSDAGEKVALKIADNAVPSSENNPFKREKWNPDMQRLVSETNPALAKQLMKEAGLL